jgi:hypothetical protein
MREVKAASVGFSGPVSAYKVSNVILRACRCPTTPLSRVGRDPDWCLSVTSLICYGRSIQRINQGAGLLM